MDRALLMLMFVSVAVISGCKRAESIIACASSEELNCPQSAVKVTSLGANQYAVAGCGKAIHVTCKGPADGCLINESRHALNTRICFH